jgi:hypothetical protein
MNKINGGGIAIFFVTVTALNRYPCSGALLHINASDMEMN